MCDCRRNRTTKITNAWNYILEIQSNLAISNSVNSKSPLFRRKIECPWIYPSPLRFPGYFEAPLFRTFFHFPWDFEIAGFDCIWCSCNSCSDGLGGVPYEARNSEGCRLTNHNQLQSMWWPSQASQRSTRGTKFLHFRRMCDGRHIRTTRIRIATQGPSRGKDGGWSPVIIGLACFRGRSNTVD